MMFHLIAQIKLDSPADIIDNTREISVAVDKTVGILWDYLKSPLFIKISEVAAIIAALGVGFWVVKWIKEVAKSEEFFVSDKMPQIAFGLFLAVLLGTPTARGKLLADVLVSYDAFATSLSNTVLLAARPDPTKDPVASVQVRQAVAERAYQDKTKCEKLPLLSSERTNCADEAMERVKVTLEPYRRQEWAFELQQELIAVLSFISPGSYIEGVGELSATEGQLALDLFGDGLSKSLILFTYAITVVFLLILRVAKPLVSVIFPLYIGLSYVPSSRPPVIWASGVLVDVVLVEIIFKILLSMIAELALNLPLQIGTLVVGLMLTLGGIPLSIILGRRISDGLGTAGLAALPFLARR
ncbi:MAG: hypothetical protein HC851_19910 [Acaryochloris sp. RU_4_1]|nr:hypothetical protein [Acaryochloris sp. RU_4_1]NJR56494.1 hypothetical protein [Acaryochloris sp. CRU_2_0]